MHLIFVTDANDNWFAIMSGPVLIYGATGGVGSCLARALASGGRGLHLVARNALELRTLAEELGAGWTAADVLDDDAFAEISAQAPQSLDGVVYAVGSLNLKPLQRIKPDDLVRDFRINAAAAALAVRAALPALRASEKGASVVLFSSVAATRGFAFHSSIGMAKAAVEGLTRSLAAELAPHIRVNAIAPSLTQTPLAEPLLSSAEACRSLAAMHPLRRLGTAVDMASLAAFLLAPEATWITGQVLGVDGGRGAIASK